MMYRKTTRQRVALLALLAATATVVTLDFRANPGGPVRRVQDVAVSVLAPLQDGISRVSRPIGEFLSGLAELPQLRSENARLQAEVRELEEQAREVPETLRENETLRELSDLKAWKDGKQTGARVIGGSISNLESSRLIDKGTDDGVAEGMSVVAADGLVGRVVFAAPNYSKVLLIVDPRHAVGARLTRSGETGIVKGNSERDDLRFELIAPGTRVREGETVVTSGYDRGIYPSGIPIGRVVTSRMARDRLSKVAEVRPFAEFGRLDVVLVLLESGPLKGSSGG